MFITIKDFELAYPLALLHASEPASDLYSKPSPAGWGINNQATVYGIPTRCQAVVGVEDLGRQGIVPVLEKLQSLFGK